MKIARGRIIGIGVVVIVAAAIAWSMRPKPLLVDTALVDERPLEATVDADGRTRVRQRYTLVTPVSGRLERRLPHPVSISTAFLMPAISVATTARRTNASQQPLRTTHRTWTSAL